MKIFILATVIAVTGIVLGDVVIGIFGVVSLACAGIDMLDRHYPAPRSVQA